MTAAKWPQQLAWRARLLESCGIIFRQLQETSLLPRELFSLGLAHPNCERAAVLLRSERNDYDEPPRAVRSHH